MINLDAYYILDGTSVRQVGRAECYEWQAAEPKAKIIRQDDVGQFWVSTVFLTHDHRFTDDGSPVVFETTVFAKEANGTVNFTDLYRDRCSTHADALKMHERVKLGVEAGEIPEPYDAAD